MMGTMSMYYVTDPDRIVGNIQSLLDVPESDRKKKKTTILEPVIKKPTNRSTQLVEHTVDTREQVRDILE
jgi:hypothetical protein